MRASTDTAVQRCEGREIMHKVVKHADDSLCAEQGHGSDGGGVVMWWGKCSSQGCSPLGSRRAWWTGVISSLMPQQGVSYISDVAVDGWATCTETPSILFRSYFTFSCYSHADLRGINVKEQCLHPSLEGRGNVGVLVAASVPVKDKRHCTVSSWAEFKCAAPTRYGYSSRHRNQIIIHVFVPWGINNDMIALLGWDKIIILCANRFILIL